ncbi:MAG: hypothetical protein ACI4KF_04680 [Huintestinicola sp.]
MILFKGIAKLFMKFGLLLALFTAILAITGYMADSDDKSVNQTSKAGNNK